ncbi:MAG: hypothetical protein AMXMBFR84_03290 [Candidatus Hydrogenedentota bacterium]
MLLDGIIFSIFLIAAIYRFVQWRQGKGKAAKIFGNLGFALIWLYFFLLNDFDRMRRIKLADAFMRQSLSALETGEIPKLTAGTSAFSGADLEDFVGYDFPDNYEIELDGFADEFHGSVSFPDGSRIRFFLQDENYSYGKWLPLLNSPDFGVSHFIGIRGDREENISK